MTNEMRKLMEAVDQLNEGWDPSAIAKAIYDEINDDWENPVKDAFKDSSEPYRAAIYKYGQLSGLFNPETLDGSEIYHEIVDALEDMFFEDNVKPSDIKKANIGEDDEQLLGFGSNDEDDVKEVDDSVRGQLARLSDAAKGMNLHKASEYIDHVLTYDYDSLDKFDVPMMLRRQAEGKDYE